MKKHRFFILLHIDSFLTACQQRLREAHRSGNVLLNWILTIHEFSERFKNKLTEPKLMSLNNDAWSWTLR